MYNVLAVVICAVFLASQGVHGHVDLSVAGANTLHAGSFAPRTLLQLDGEGASSLSPGATVGLSIAVVVLVAVAGGGPEQHMASSHSSSRSTPRLEQA
jgi:hypothetical protein